MMKKNKKTNVKLDYKSLTISQIENELKRETYKFRYFKILRSTVYSLVIVAAFAALLATLFMPVLQISGSSMTPTFNDGEIVVSIKTKQLSTGDIIAFYHGNKILIKRVIAKAGEWVNIDKDGKVYVNSKLLKESYVDELSFGDTDVDFPYQVPDGHWFVLGDKRTLSIDSRNSEIGSVSENDVVGKLFFRVWPIKKIGKID